MKKIRSSELLALIIDEDIQEISMNYSELYDIKEELRKNMIFCDFTVMDFEDLYVSYPRNVTIQIDKVILSSKGLQNHPIKDFILNDKYSDKREIILSMLRKYFIK